VQTAAQGPAGADWRVLLFAAAAVFALLIDLLPQDRKVLNPAAHWDSHAGASLWGRTAGAASELPPRVLGFLEDKLDGQRFYALPGSRFQGNAAAARGLASLGGYHAAKLAAADSVIKALPQGGLPLLSRFAVRYLVSSRARDFGPQLPVALEAEEAVYENPAARPRLSLAERVAVEAPARSRARLCAGEAEEGVVYLDRAPDVAIAPPGTDGDSGGTTGAAAGSAGEPGRLRETQWGLDELRCALTLERPAVLVLADMNYPGWRVQANGQERPLLTADGFFRAVALPAGDWEVRFHFAPESLGALAWLRRAAFLIIVAALGLELWRWRRGRGLRAPEGGV
jgi:hypothetical protein